MLTTEEVVDSYEILGNIYEQFYKLEYSVVDYANLLAGELYQLAREEKMPIPQLALRDYEEEETPYARSPKRPSVSPEREGENENFSVDQSSTIGFRSRLLQGKSIERLCRVFGAKKCMGIISVLCTFVIGVFLSAKMELGIQVRLRGIASQIITMRG